MKYQKWQFLVIPNKDIIKWKPPTLQCIYFWVCSFSDEQWCCYPSIKTLADCSWCTSRVVIKYLKELELLWILVKESRFKGNEKISNLYQIIIVEQGGLLLKVTRGSEPESQPSEPESQGGSEPESHRTISTYLTKYNKEDIQFNEDEKEIIKTFELWFNKLEDIEYRHKLDLLIQLLTTSGQVSFANWWLVSYENEQWQIMHKIDKVQIIDYKIAKIKAIEVVSAKDRYKVKDFWSTLNNRIKKDLSPKKFN